MNKCFICDKLFHEGDDCQRVQSRGINTLIDASEKRGLHQHVDMLQTLEEILVHTACRKNYTKETLIKAACRRQSLLTESNDEEMAGHSSGESSFNFEKSCFFCSNDVDENFIEKEIKYRPEHRNKILQVTKSTLRSTVLNKLVSRTDDFAKQIVLRISAVPDLVEVHAIYHLQCYRDIFKGEPSGSGVGRPVSIDVESAMNDIYSYLSMHSEECQFSLTDLMNSISGDYKPDERTVIRHLKDKYDDEILIFQSRKNMTFICFTNMGHKVLAQNWYEQRESNFFEERLRVVREAADIIGQDIKSQFYETSCYPPSDIFFQGLDADIPETLSTFLNHLIVKPKRGLLDQWKRKCTSIAHSIISAVRPRSFVSSLLVGIGCYLYKKFGSKNLVNVLSNLGFSSSYAEVSKFEAACIQRTPIFIKDDAFSQFVFDNADFNVNSLDGHGTFHSMGGIQCVTPFDAIEADRPIPRPSEKISATNIAELGSIPVKTYYKEKSAGLERIKVADVNEINPISNEILPTTLEFMWLCGKWCCYDDIPGWNGLMEQILEKKSFEKSKIISLPFINSPPSNYDTIFTTILYAIQKAKELKQSVCFVTFDQPLYWKARDIVANTDMSPDFANVVLRLGGFHLVLSFLSAIGHIMSGSGIEEVLTLIYAPNCVEQILSGHAYARAIRAHTLMCLSLVEMILDQCDFSEEERDEIDLFLKDSNRTVILEAENSSIIQNAVKKYGILLNELEKTGPTAKLWVQYVRMVTLLKQFIEAERSGNWYLHLETIQRMLPYFHAAGNFLYAKSAHLYLQDMLALKEKMSAQEFEKFTSNGLFTVRRSDKFWSGIMTDMTIEQTLMRSMKTSGGLTPGRGITDSTITTWTLGMVYFQSIGEQVEKFCGIYSATTEQHVDARSKRISRDNKDVGMLYDWFSSHQPFEKKSDLISLSNGIVAHKDINCHLAQEIGTSMISKIINCTYNSVTFKRKDKVLPISAVSNTITVDEVSIPINPLLLFQRLCSTKQSESDLQDFLCYELAPYPLPIFDEFGMRKGTKSNLYKCFNCLPKTPQLGNERLEVVDGGFLLHRVVWQRNVTFEQICQGYVNYVQRHFSSNVIVVFDGYTDDANLSGTKTSERLRRAKTLCSPDILFDETTRTMISQAKFLSNNKNKSRFITMLKIFFLRNNIQVDEAIEDADTLIVNVALQNACSYDSVVIIGEDIDLLVLLTALGQNTSNVYLRKPARRQSEEQLYTPKSLKHKLLDEQNILFLHAFSGCDTTSAIFNVGKEKVVSTFVHNQELLKSIELFKGKRIDKDILAQIGEQFMIMLFGGDKNDTSINVIRYRNFLKSVTKSKCNLSSLPPTATALRQHTLRTYYQVQSWLGNYLDPTDWGWRRGTRGLEPIVNTSEPAPSSILQLISCKCTKNCGKACGCRKAGLKCSTICLNCNGDSCDNVRVLLLDNDELTDLNEDYLPDNLEQQINAQDEDVNTLDQELSEPEPMKRIKH